MGRHRHLKPSRFAGLLGLASGMLFLSFLFCLYFASAGYQISVIQEQLLSQVQKQSSVRELINDPRFKTMLTGGDSTTKLILASASSLEDDASSADLESAFNNLDQNKAAFGRDQRGAKLLDTILANYRSWQTARQELSGTQARLTSINADRDKLIAEYKMVIEDVEAIFETKDGEAAADKAQLDPEDPFNLYGKGLLAGIPRVRGVPDDLNDEGQIAGLLRQPVDQSEPPSTKVERIRQTMAEISAKYDKVLTDADEAEDLAKAAEKKAAGLKSRLKVDLFSLLAFCRRTGLDNGSLRMYQEISRLWA